MPNAVAILLCVLALICGVFLLGGLGLLITGKNRRGSVWVGTTTFAVLVAVFTYGSLTLW